MKGLILKDIMTMKKTFKSYLILFVLYMVIDMMSDQSSLSMSIAIIVATLIPVATISYDEKSKWDKLVNTMPFSRREIVCSKYILGLGLTAVSLVVVFAISPIPMAERFIAVAATGVVCLFYQALLIPALFKFGSERGRIIMMIVMLAPVVIGGLLAKVIDFESINAGPLLDENIAMAAAAAGILVAALYAVSVMVSVKIYSAKEF